MKKTISLIVCLLILFIPPAVYAEDKPVSFITDGVPAEFNDDTGIPYISPEGRTLMPLRVCLNAIGCVVEWDPETKTVLTQKGSVIVEIPIGKSEIIVNGAVITTDAQAVIKNERTYLPLRAVMEAYGYAVEWDAQARTVFATELTAANINGGSTGIFQRKQLHFSGFDGIQADVTLPYVTELEKGDCPYVYFGFDFSDDKGNAEGGFQFIEDPAHPLYNKWTVFMRQGSEWRWGNNISIEQGETRHLKFYAEYVSNVQTDLIIELDGREVIRKKSAVTNFDNTSAKTVISMAMTEKFDGENCFSRSVGAKISNTEVRMGGSDEYHDFTGYPLYSEWRPFVGAAGMWYGTANCVPSYIHYEPDGKVSILQNN